MELGERAIESSGAFAEAEREREIERMKAKLALEGDEFCQDCGEEIPAARRAALPSATRCIDCQAKLERRAR